MQLFSADAKIFLNKLKLFFDPEKLKKSPSKVAYLIAFARQFQYILPKSAQSAHQAVQNSHSFFNVSYT